MFVLHEQTLEERLILEGQFLETSCEEPLGAHAENTVGLWFRCTCRGGDGATENREKTGHGGSEEKEETKRRANPEETAEASCGPTATSARKRDFAEGAVLQSQGRGFRV